MITQRSVCIFVLPVMFALTAPDRALAATVAVTTDSPYVTQQGPVFTAEPGEANDVTVVHEIAGPDRRIATIHDSGAPLDVGAGCMASDAHTARCLTSGLAIRLELGDGDDRLRTLVPYAPLEIIASGGPGDDVLDLRAADARQGYEGILDGGGGRDRLYGGPFADFLTDGDRDGAPGDAGPGPDVLDGGSAARGIPRGVTRDIVSYQQRTTPVRVDLARHLPAGEPGEGDIVRRVEAVDGGAGADFLAGTNGPDFLVGGPGHDTLIGRGGDDMFGLPLVFAVVMPVRPPGGSAGDRVFCGRGRDEIFGPANAQFVEPTCEGLVIRGTFVRPYPTAVGRRSLRFTVGCSLNEESLSTCSGTLTLREARRPHRVLATGAIPDTHGEDAAVARLRLTAAGRLRATSRPLVLARVEMRGDHLPHTSWTIRIRLPA